MFKWITRAQWNARPPNCVNALPIAQTKGIAVHYSGSMADIGPDGGAVMRGHQRFHIEDRDWCDIAYTGEFNNKGQIYEGRGWGRRTAAQGTNKGNDEYYAFCFQGADKENQDDVKPAGRRALVQIINEYRRLTGRWPDVKGHSHFHPTSCPGNELRSFIALKGWLVQPTEPLIWPRYFFHWAAWYLGEGEFEKVGPQHKPSRPTHPRIPVGPRYWAALRLFLKRRKK